MSRFRRQNQHRNTEDRPASAGSGSSKSAWGTRFGLALIGMVAFGAAYMYGTKIRQDSTSTQPLAKASALAADPASQSESRRVSETDVQPEMIWVPAGEFVMGTTEKTQFRNEQPAHKVKIDGFWIDEHEVTNAQFRKFVEATNYQTTAEKAPDWEELKKSVPPGTPKPPAEVLVPGSLVFTPPAHPVRTDDVSQWWTWIPGADWRHPEGPKSSIADRDDHPVVQISWYDATAYAKWAGKRLPTEAEWEYASRGKLASKKFAWGDEPPQESSREANIWQGTFPNKNDKLDGWERTAPIKSFPANSIGLHDMAGNVWEWCSDWYRADAYERLAARGQIENPSGPSDSWDPAEPNAAKRVIRGGSFLCHVTYCESYRNAARRGTTPDTGMSHLGFRCVIANPLKAPR